MRIRATYRPSKYSELSGDFDGYDEDKAVECVIVAIDKGVATAIPSDGIEFIESKLHNFYGIEWPTK